MTAHPIPDNADLVELIELNKRWSIEDCCAARKARRLGKLSASARKGAETKHNRMMAGHPKLVPDRVGANFRCAETASPMNRAAVRLGPAGGHRLSQGQRENDHER